MSQEMEIRAVQAAREAAEMAEESRWDDCADRLSRLLAGMGMAVERQRVLGDRAAVQLKAALDQIVVRTALAWDAAGRKEEDRRDAQHLGTLCSRIDICADLLSTAESARRLAALLMKAEGLHKSGPNCVWGPESVRQEVDNICRSQALGTPRSDIRLHTERRPGAAPGAIDRAETLIRVDYEASQVPAYARFDIHKRHAEHQRGGRAGRPWTEAEVAQLRGNPAFLAQMKDWVKQSNASIAAAAETSRRAA